MLEHLEEGAPELLALQPSLELQLPLLLRRLDELAARKKALLEKSIEVLRRGLESEPDTPSADRRAELLDALRRPA